MMRPQLMPQQSLICRRFSLQQHDPTVRYVVENLLAFHLQVLTLEEAEVLVKECDLDGDGKLCYAEFAKFIDETT
jgi:hypothetical protein